MVKQDENIKILNALCSDRHNCIDYEDYDNER